MRDKLSKLDNRLIKIMQENEKARNCDGAMIWEYIRLFHESDVKCVGDTWCIPISLVSDLHKSDLKRARRKVQRLKDESGNLLYAPTDTKIAKRRNLLQSDYISHYAEDKSTL